MKLPSKNSIKLKLYKCLIQPETGWWHILYHLTIFGVVLLTLLLYAVLTMNDYSSSSSSSSSSNNNNNNSSSDKEGIEETKNNTIVQETGQDSSSPSFLLFKTVFAMESLLSVYFSLELILRLWSAGVAHQYKGLRGRLKFLMQFTSLIDLLVLTATLCILIVGFRQNDNYYASSALLMNLRFMQILRLLHVDHRFVTWKLMAKVLRLHRLELISAGYLAFLGLLTMTTVVYTVEAYYNDHQSGDDDKSAFGNFGDALWWGVVTLTTIGYGDIVPKFWVSKLVTSIFALACVSVFTLASSVIGVGLALMVQDQSRQKQAQKQTTAAARVLQTFWRQRLLASKNFERISYYRYDLMYKLRAHEMTPYVQETPASGQQQNLPKSSSTAMFTFLNVMRSRVTTAGALAGLSLSSLTRGHQQHLGHKRLRESLHRSASVDDLEELNRHASVTTRKAKTTIHRKVVDEITVKDIFRPLSPQPKNGVEVKISITPAHDAADVNVVFSVDTPLLTSGGHRRSTTVQDDDDTMQNGTPTSATAVPRHYKYALKAIWRMKFMAAKKQFKLSRKSYDLNDISEEVSHSKAAQLFGISKAQNKLERLAGKPTISLLTRAEKELGLLQRLELVESKMAELDKKADLILEMATQLSDRIVRQQRSAQKTNPNPNPNPNLLGALNHHHHPHQNAEILQ